MKLLNLPLIPLQDVLKQLELSELFTISLCSLKFKKLVKTMKFGFELIQIETFDNDSRDTVISIFSGEQESKVVILENGFLLEEDTTILKIGGIEILCEVSWCSYGVVYIKHDPEIQPSKEILDYDKHGEPCVVPISTKFSDPKNYGRIHEKLEQSYRRSKTRKGNGKWIDPLDSHPQLLALLSVNMDPLTVTGGKIIEEAKRGMGKVVSAHEEKEFCYTGCLKGINGTAVKKESQLMKDQSEENKKIVEGQEAAKFTPFHVMNVSNLGDDVEHIKYLLTSSSGFMLRGLETAYGINRATTKNGRCY